ncbi:hypothetical protein F4808DRAFT_440580 [Astrocystis sublimbata]|nr:hypothetical protein F4808DRAFT_440580 [Astrocystis sublimbata]
MRNPGHQILVTIIKTIALIHRDSIHTCSLRNIPRHCHSSASQLITTEHTSSCLIIIILPPAFLLPLLEPKSGVEGISRSRVLGAERLGARLRGLARRDSRLVGRAHVRQLIADSIHDDAWVQCILLTLGHHRVRWQECPLVRLATSPAELEVHRWSACTEVCGAARACIGVTVVGIVVILTLVLVLALVAVVEVVIEVSVVIVLVLVLVSIVDLVLILSRHANHGTGDGSSREESEKEVLGLHLDVIFASGVS